MTREEAKKIAEKLLEPRKDKVNRNAKDSVFTDLFDRPEYLLQLYRVLHPEDTESDEDDLTVVTLESLLMKNRYNDLGFMVGNRLMILVEAQSTWSVNILVRFLIYIADTYNRYIEKNELDLYASKKIEIPVPELYVIYTGKGEYPDEISLSSHVFEIEDCALEVTARVIRDSKKGDILYQYIMFARIFDEQIKLHGRTRKAVEETLRICREQAVLKDYLAKKEVAEFMFYNVDKEKLMERMLREERNEGRAEGRAEGRSEGILEGKLSTLGSLVQDGVLSVKEAAARAGMSESAFRELEL